MIAATNWRWKPEISVRRTTTFCSVPTWCAAAAALQLLAGCLLARHAHRSGWPSPLLDLARPKGLYAPPPFIPNPLLALYCIWRGRGRDGCMGGDLEHAEADFATITADFAHTASDLEEPWPVGNEGVKRQVRHGSTSPCRRYVLGCTCSYYCASWR